MGSGVRFPSPLQLELASSSRCPRSQPAATRGWRDRSGSSVPATPGKAAAATREGPKADWPQHETESRSAGTRNAGGGGPWHEEERGQGRAGGAGKNRRRVTTETQPPVLVSIDNLARLFHRRARFPPLARAKFPLAACTPARTPRCRFLPFLRRLRAATRVHALPRRAQRLSHRVGAKRDVGCHITA